MCTKLIPELSVSAHRVNTITTLGCIMTKASRKELSAFTFPFQTNCYDASCAVCGATFWLICGGALANISCAGKLIIKTS